MDRNRQPLISIIIPVYNRRSELIRCLNSVSNQDFTGNFEVIVVDDGSSDSLKDIIDNFQTKLNLIYFKIENFGGPSLPRNLGAKKSKGKWLSFLDCDDSWNSNRLSEVSKHLPFLDKGILYHKLKVLNENKKFIPFYKRNIGNRIYLKPLDQFMKCGNPIPNSSVVIDRESFFLLGGFDESHEMKAYEDFDLWVRAAERKLPFLYLDKKLGIYYNSPDSISAISKNSINRLKFFYKKHNFQNFPMKFRKNILSYRRYNLGTLYMSDDKYKKRALVLLKYSKHLFLYKNKISRFYKLLKLITYPNWKKSI